MPRTRRARPISRMATQNQSRFAIPLLEDALAHEADHGGGNGAEIAAEVKPRWRGWIHAGTFPVAVAGGIVLISLAHGATAKWASAVFMLTSMLLFGISALYHRIDWQPKTKQLFRRLDHANIFLLIAGTYTPIALLALPPAQGNLLLGARLGRRRARHRFSHVLDRRSARWLYVCAVLAARLGRCRCISVTSRGRISPRWCS